MDLKEILITDLYVKTCSPNNHSIILKGQFTDLKLCENSFIIYQHALEELYQI